MLTDAEVTQLREELATSRNPLFFYDDDPDGLCAFLLLYRMHREGHGVIIKTAPKITLQFFHKVEENNPDKIFVLDVPLMEQEFVDKAKKPLFWLDHHQPQQLQKVHYFNPHIRNPEEYTPTTRLAYQISNNPEDLWLAAIGCLGDWHLPDFIDEFVQKYPHLLSKDPQKPELEHAVYAQPIGKLVRIFSFLLKGPTSDVNKCVKVLSRIKTPDEILQQTTSAGKYLYNHFEKVNQNYVPLIEKAEKAAGKSKLLLFNYSEQKWSFTSDLANELATLYPQKVILITRQKNGEMKCSIRCRKPISEALEKALVGIDGYGGGHPLACGAVIKEHDWEKFLERFKEEIKFIK